MGMSASINAWIAILRRVALAGVLFAAPGILASAPC